MGDGVLDRQGTLSPLLVRPVHPIHQHIANNLTFKLLTMAVVIPVVVVLTIVFRPNFTISAWTALAFIPALILAMALRFAVEWTLASPAFWVTRVTAINQLYFVVFLFLSGFVVPLTCCRTGASPSPSCSLLPDAWLPGRAAPGRLSPNQAWLALPPSSAGWRSLPLLNAIGRAACGSTRR